MSFLQTVRSDKDVHFTGAIAQNASEEENIVLPSSLKGIGGNARFTVKGLTIISDENLDWEVMLFANDLFQESDLDNDRYIGKHSFVAANAVRIGGTGAFLYYINTLEIPYQDADRTGELHVALVNRSAAGKSAGAAGEIVVQFHVETMEAP